MNIKSIHFDKNCSVITAKLEMSTDISNVVAPYKVGTGSGGNIMPLHIYKKIYFLE